ncbi:MAG: DUF4157 domain-containing protein [Candidatus Methanoperedens sp.]|nr:DUF4157 domain-containing protein [Candidatus Methanoperedens sp.]
MAEQVMRMPEPAVCIARATKPKIQRLCPECQDDLKCQLLDEEVERVQTKNIVPGPLSQKQTPEETYRLQAQSKSGSISTVRPSVGDAIHTLQVSGQSLPDPVRSFMEPRFNTEFSAVRIHTDHHAHDLARSVNAQAFTVGRDIVFGAGHYAPDTGRGKHLIAHELTHVVQQIGMHQGERARYGTVSDSISSQGGTILQRQPDEVARMEIEPRSRHIVIIMDTGTRYIGTVDTDLPAGRYQITPDRGRRRWVISGSRPGLRFDLTLEGADPWALSYASTVELIVSEEPTLSLAEIQTRLNLLDAILARLEERHTAASELRAVIARGRANLVTVRNQLHGVPDDVRVLFLAEDVVERVERALLNLGQQRLALVDRPDYYPAIGRVQRLYIDALGHLFQPDLITVFNQAEQGAKGLPRALIEVDLARMQSHAELNRAKLVPSEQLFQWVRWVRIRLDRFEAQVRALEEARQKQSPDVATRTQQIEQEVQIIQLSIEGLGQFDAAVRAREYMMREAIGFGGTQLVDAMNRLMDRVRAIMTASQAANLGDLRTRVTSLRGDANVDRFYRALPGLIGASRLITALAVAFAASWAAASVGGIVGGAATRTLVTGGGLTVRGGLAIGGAVTLEALTFTLVSQGLGTVLLGQRPTAHDLLVDFAWNLGLFSVFRGLSVGIGRGLYGTSIAALSGPIQTTATFPVLHGYGVLRFRVESGRWPSDQELDQMTAQNLLMMVGLMVGMRAVQRWIPAGRRPTALQVFRQRYGWRFEAIDAGRQRLIEELGQLVRAGRATDQAAVDSIRPRAHILEDECNRIVAEAETDPKVNLAEIRTQLKQAHTTVIEGQSELLALELGLAEDTGLLSAGSQRAYTYRSGKTNDLEGRLRALNARVTKTQESVTGQRTLTAQFGNDPPLTFQERQRPAYGTREVNIDASHPSVQNLYTRFSIADPQAQRMIIQMLTYQLSRAPTQTVDWAARQVELSLNGMRRAAPAGKTVEELVLELRGRGIIASTAPAAPLVTKAQELVTAGIIRSSEWLSGRTDDQFIGVVGEWLGWSVVQGAAPAGARVFRNVRFVGDVFTDAQGTTPRQMSSGRPMVNTDVAELDHMTASESGGRFDVHSVTNIKAVTGLGGDASTQNANALSCIQTPRGQLVPIREGSHTYYARIRSVSGVDTATNQTIDFTTTQEAQGGARSETLGPQGARGYTGSLGYSAREILILAKLLKEIQLMHTPGY